ncbi:PilZ domain-containing protein [Novosphingobium sp. Leaf2]|uniref:PilZ domain-containing protein n=1 Tax=Novosphingobium sp. Leaf2 TaxID=1735670 RepID=UPI0006F9955C|nr:PilZ domain-containing protein [Novosphingobium sp. Leaf2]KQM14686.1 hypothetical protein ASE49_10955 [Novosphingobium sp. Leaf2]
MAETEGFGTAERPEWLKTLTRRRRLVADADGEMAQLPKRSPRVRTLIRAVIGAEGRPGEDAIVRNVSPGGMCIASRTLLPRTGETLRVALPGQGDLQAEVRWVGNGEFGVQLKAALDIASLHAANRGLNAGFSAALDRLLGVSPCTEQGSAHLRPC